MIYAITDRRLYAADEPSRRRRLLDFTALWVANGVALIQLREKDLSGRDQVELARAMQKIVQGTNTGLLINGRPDVALAAGADGVHLPGGPDALTPTEVRNMFATAENRNPPCISISCHTLQEVKIAQQQAADCILFAPVFEKIVPPEEALTAPTPEIHSPQVFPGSGLIWLRQVCFAARSTPVFALGGVTEENAAQCLQAGASGVAAIRWMLEPPSSWHPFV